MFGYLIAIMVLRPRACSARRRGRPDEQSVRDAQLRRVAQRRRASCMRRWWPTALAGVGCIVARRRLPVPLPRTASCVHSNGTIIAIAYALMALGLNVVVGIAGLLDLGYVAFYALGAYSLGWFGSEFFAKAEHPRARLAGGQPTARHPPQLPADPRRLGDRLRRSPASIIGLPTLRLRGDYIAIVTLAFGEIIGVIAVNGQSISLGGGMTLTAGNLGISAVDAPYFPGSGTFSLLDQRPWYWLIFGILLIVLFVNLRRPRLPARPGLGGAARGRGRRRVDGHPAGEDQAARVRDRRGVRRHVRGVLRRLLHQRQRRPVPVRVLDLHPRHGDHRRARLDLGRAPGRPAARATSTTT